MLKEVNGLRVVNIPERSQNNDGLIKALNDEIVFLRNELCAKHDIIKMMLEERRIDTNIDIKDVGVTRDQFTSHIL